MAEEHLAFEYFVSEKNGFLVASLIGSLSGSAVPKLQELHSQIAGSCDSKKVILNLRDLTLLSKDSIPAFAMLQKTVREKEMTLKICGLKPGVRDLLEKTGILRVHEVSDNLQIAIQSLTTERKRAA